MSVPTNVDVNGISFNIEIDGPEGAPWLTFSHSLATQLRSWDAQVDMLKDRFRCLRYDLRGHGSTPATPGPYTFPMLEDEAIGILDALEIEATHWAGLSIGGMIGYGLAINHPSRILSLTAVDSRANAPPDYQAYFQHRIDVARDEGMEALAKLTVERWFTPESVAAEIPVLETVRNWVRNTDPVGHAGLCEALKTLAYGPDMHRITCPTLIIGGAKDKGAPPDKLKAEAADVIAGAQQVIVPDAGHQSALENPPAFNAAFKKFLAAQL
jgi:3-oxoadipate enol-lactonase